MGCQHFNATLGGRGGPGSFPQDSFYSLLKLSCFWLVFQDSFFFTFFSTGKGESYDFCKTQVHTECQAQGDPAP